MKTTTDEIKKILKTTWPELEQIWLLDKIYWLPTIDEVKEFLKNSQTNSLRKSLGDLR